MQQNVQNADASVIQHITSHSQSTDGYGQNGANATDVIQTAPAPMGISTS